MTPKTTVARISTDLSIWPSLRLLWHWFFSWIEKVGSKRIEKVSGTDSFCSANWTCATIAHPSFAHPRFIATKSKGLGEQLSAGNVENHPGKQLPESLLRASFS